MGFLLMTELSHRAASNDRSLSRRLGLKKYSGHYACSFLEAVGDWWYVISIARHREHAYLPCVSRLRWVVRTTRRASIQLTLAVVSEIQHEITRLVRVCAVDDYTHTPLKRDVPDDSRSIDRRRPK